jgi:putative redox protein
VAKISSHIGKELYRTEIASPSGSTLLSDEPLDRGGQNKGLSPTELLAASLAACTSVTLRMYADRKGWDLAEINTHIELVRDDLVNKTAIERSIQLIGNLDETQKARLLAIANNCPVHRILNNPIEIKTELI